MTPRDLQRALILAETHLWAYVREAARTKQIAAQLSDLSSDDRLHELYLQKTQEEASFALYMQSRDTLFEMLKAMQQSTESCQYS